MTKEQIKELAKLSHDYEFCLVFLTREFIKGSENKTWIEIVKEYENI